MRTVILVIVAACSLVVGRMFPTAAAAQSAVETSPHAQALRLVFEKGSDRIRAVDQENWWHDVKTREWSAKRPFAPGGIDSTHLFVVSYRIDGKLVESWMVDTRAGTVQQAPAAAMRPGR